MQTQETTQTASQSNKADFYANHMTVSESLADAIVEQFGGWAEFERTAHLVYGNGILSIENFKDLKLMTTLFAENHKDIMSWLIEQAEYLDYDDVIDLVIGGREDRSPRQELAKLTEEEVALGLFVANSKAHSTVVMAVTDLVGQFFGMDYGTFLSTLKK